MICYDSCFNSDFSSNPGGIIFAQPSNNMMGSQSYMMPSNSQTHAPQLVPFSGNSLLRPAGQMPMGAMVVLAPASGTPNHPGFIQLPADGRLIQQPNSLSSQSLSHSSSLASTHQVAYASASANIQQNHSLQPQLLPYSQVNS